MAYQGDGKQKGVWQIGGQWKGRDGKQATTDDIQEEGSNDKKFDIINQDLQVLIPS